MPEAMGLADPLPESEPGGRRTGPRHGAWAAVLLAADGEWRDMAGLAVRARLPERLARTPVNTLAWLGCLEADTVLRPARFRLAAALGSSVLAAATGAARAGRVVGGRHYCDFAPGAEAEHVLVAEVPRDGGSARLFLCARVALPDRGGPGADPRAPCPGCADGAARARSRGLGPAL